MKTTRTVGDRIEALGTSMRVRGRMLGAELFGGDLQEYWPLEGKGGVLLVHDTVMWPGARQAAIEFASESRRVVTLASGGGSGVSIIRRKTS